MECQWVWKSRVERRNKTVDREETWKSHIGLNSPTQITNTQTKYISWSPMELNRHFYCQIIIICTIYHENQFIFDILLYISFILLSYAIKWVIIFIFNIFSRRHLTTITTARLTPFTIYSLKELTNQTVSLNQWTNQFETTSRLFRLFKTFWKIASFFRFVLWAQNLRS